MTDYMVLRKNKDGHWEEHRLAPNTTSKRRAVAAVLNQDVDAGEVNGNEYVAIPLRSWQPVKVQVETALKFS